ncbi:MAG: FAD-dependent oxidoreductase [Acidimicrobiales bacterium]
MTEFDAVVVGAGPAGSAAALVLARAGRTVALVERGPFPGSKNMYGGVVYGRVLDTLIPQWWDEIPVERWVTRRSTMVMTPTQSLSVDFRTTAWGQAPYNGCTTLRPDFDAWFAGKAEAAGATLITSTTVTGLRRGAGGRICGVATDREGGAIESPVVIACDGVNSFLAKEAGLYPTVQASNFTLGAKEVLHLPRAVIEDRFALTGNEGVDIEILGCTGDVAGGGFVYTNLDTVAVGVVLALDGLAASAVRPEELIADLKAHPAIAPLVAGAELKEYSAHLIPEGGYDAMPELVADGLLVAGDAACMCLAAGLWLEGVNYAIGAGIAAGEAAAEALATGDTSAHGLAGYRRRLDEGFVLQDHRKLRRAPHIVLSDRVQQHMPELVCDIAEGMFTVENPKPKRGLLTVARQAQRRSGLRLRDLVKDAIAALRTYR